MAKGARKGIGKGGKRYQPYYGGENGRVSLAQAHCASSDVCDGPDCGPVRRTSEVSLEEGFLDNLPSPTPHVPAARASVVVTASALALNSLEQTARLQPTKTPIAIRGETQEPQVPSPPTPPDLRGDCTGSYRDWA